MGANDIIWMQHTNVSGKVKSTQGQFDDLWVSKGWTITTAPPGGDVRTAPSTFIQPSAPLYPVQHDIWFDTVNDVTKYYDGASWLPIGTSSFVTIGEYPPVPQQFYHPGDPDYTAAFQRLFTSGKTSCYIPPSDTTYDVSATLNMPVTMSLDAARDATIRAVAPISGPLITVGEATANRWSFKHFSGGNWDCNNLASGIVVLATRSSIVREIKILNSTGNFFQGGDSANPGTCNGLRVQDCFTDRDVAGTVPAGSYGIWILGADCHVLHTTAVGSDIMFRNDGSGNRYIDCHGWGWGGHLPTIIFDSNGFDVDYIGCKADSPSLYGWYMRKVGWRITGGEVLNGPDAVDGVIGIHVDPSHAGNPQGSILGTQFNGSLTHSLAQDYDGQVPAATLSAVGCVSFNVITQKLGIQDMLRGRNGSQTNVQTTNTLPGATRSWTFQIPDVAMPTFYAGRTYTLDLIARDGANNLRNTATCQLLVYQDSSANGVKVVLCSVDNKLGTAFASGLTNGSHGLTVGVDSATGLNLTVNVQNNTADNQQYALKLT